MNNAIKNARVKTNSSSAHPFGKQALTIQIGEHEWALMVDKSEFDEAIKTGLAKIQVQPNSRRPADLMPIIVMIGDHEWTLMVDINEFNEAIH